MAAKPRYQIRSPQGQVITGVPGGSTPPPAGLYEDLQTAIDDCALYNASHGDPNYQYVIFPVIHATA